MTGYTSKVGFSDTTSRILLNAPLVAEPFRRGVDVPEGSAPMSAHSTGPTERQRLAWEATRRHGKQAAAAAELGITHATLREHLLAYMKATGEAAAPSYRLRTPLERLMARVAVEPSTGCWKWTGPVTDDGYGIIAFEGRSDRAHRVSWALHRGPIARGTVVRHLVCDNPPCCNPDHLALGSQQENIGDMVARGRQSGKREQRGESNTTAVLTEAAVITMRQERRQGSSFPAIAARHGVSPEAARHAIQGATWSHVPGAVVEPRGLQRHPNAAKTHCPRNHEYTLENTGWSDGRRRCKACDRDRFHARKAARQ